MARPNRFPRILPGKPARLPSLFAEIYDGETFDARKVQNGWNGAAFDDSAWKSVEVVHPIEPEIEWQYFPPIRKHEELQAKSVNEPKPGAYVFDFGQNLSGVARVRAKGPAGTDVKLRFAEVLNADGTIYVEKPANGESHGSFYFGWSRKRRVRAGIYVSRISICRGKRVVH